MMKKIDLSICIPTYNRASVLKKTIVKLLSVPYDNIEILISDNCSNDGTEDIIKLFADERISYYKNNENKGPFFNFIKALELGSGEYCILCSDEDDISVRNVLSIISKINNSNVGLILGDGLDCLSRRKYNYKEKLLDPSIDNLRKFGFSHHYITGMVFKRDTIMFQKYYLQLNFSNNGYLSVFPHVAIMNDTLLTYTTIYTNEVFYVSREISEHESNKKYVGSEWITPSSRIKQFESDCLYLNHIRDQLSNMQMLSLISWRFRFYLGEILRFKNRLNDGWSVDYFKLNLSESILDYNYLIYDLFNTYDKYIPNLVLHRSIGNLIKYIYLIVYKIKYRAI